MNDLRGQFIANTFQNLFQMPDITKQEFYNGIGATISVINRDGIGTIKMFYPIGGTISTYFDSNDDGIVGGEWEGWAIANGHTHSSGVATPDLRGKFIVGYDPSDSDYNTIGNNTSNKTISLTASQLPQHNHAIWFETQTVALGVSDRYRPGANQDDLRYTDNSVDTGLNGDPIDIRPAYYTLLYVIRVA